VRCDTSRSRTRCSACRRGLCRHELHRWALHGFGNRFGFIEVVLPSPAIEANIFGRHQPASRASTWPRDHFCRSTTAPRVSWPTTWNEFLPISMPTTAIGIGRAIPLAEVAGDGGAYSRPPSKLRWASFRYFYESVTRLSLLPPGLDCQFFLPAWFNIVLNP
jgi:hypothetical protein